MVTKTLEAAVKIRHRGLMHVWLLDEGDDPEVKAVCARWVPLLPKGVPSGSRPAPRKTKARKYQRLGWTQHATTTTSSPPSTPTHGPLADY
ncbi:hypothetical protein [Streptomyces sp. DHE17-7]|uniref:hypothetical protein n=1 Tax=Streptomyces sp. DHE17-7 TaxID=2759949 RepID=UPI003FA6A3D0